MGPSAVTGSLGSLVGSVGPDLVGHPALPCVEAVSCLLVGSSHEVANYRTSGGLELMLAH